jgi:predicted metal-dependent hydrolase
MTMTMKDWKKKVEQWVWTRTGVATGELGKLPYRAWFREGLTPRQAADRAFKEAATRA